MHDDQELIAEPVERYAQATNDSDVQEFGDIYTEDAILMVPDRPAVVRRTAIVDHRLVSTTRHAQRNVRGLFRRSPERPSSFVASSRSDLDPVWVRGDRGSFG